MNRLKITLIVSVFAFGLVMGCRKSHPHQVTGRKFYSTYGPEVTKTDFESQGKNGCVVENSKQGIQIRRAFVEGVLHGTSSWSFPRSEVVDYFEEYENGVLVSRGQNFENGSTKLEEQYGPQDVKIVHAWFEDGCPRMVEEYRGTELLRGNYLTADGDIESTVDKSNGMRVERDRKGVLLARQQVVAGFPVVCEEYHPNGMLFQVYTLKNGAKEGTAKVYLETGEPKRLEYWAQGLLHGEQMLYEHGVEVASVPYVQGKREGIEKRFQPGTEVVTHEVSWHSNLRHGPSIAYNLDGIASTEWYWRDTKVSPERYQSYLAKQQAARAQINIQ